MSNIALFNSISLKMNFNQEVKTLQVLSHISVREKLSYSKSSNIRSMSLRHAGVTDPVTESKTDFRNMSYTIAGDK